MFRALTTRSITIMVASIVFALLVVTVSRSPATASPGVSTPPQGLVVGKQLYREFCGKCHALSVALAAGFGNSKGGLGPLGGPSFNNLRIPYSYSVAAVTEPTGGHEIVSKKITAKQLSQVATYIAKVTIHNPIPALPTDG